MPTHRNREAVGRRFDRLREAHGDVPVVEQRRRLPPDQFDRLREEAVEGYTGSGYAWVVRSPGDAPAPTESMPPEAAAEDPQVLLVLNRGVDGPLWNLPGGGRESGETYAAAAERELREETGIEVSVDRPHLIVRGEYRPERATETADGRDPSDGDREDAVEEDRDASDDGVESGNDGAVTDDRGTDGGDETVLHLLYVHFDATYESGTIDVQEGELRGAAWFTEPPGELLYAAAFPAFEWWDDYRPDDPWWAEDRFDIAPEGWDDPDGTGDPTGPGDGGDADEN